ncbi:acetyltransferase [Amycolatopsis cynarae]|uniref:Acetyltransferase n=1 Tax=Amycolatopsis cynarae TaxID=2995223 RepID=A0ABY7B0M3_9PSEU|nr:DUF6640 family protein [Amycolatopsis sp. HUAS 11-8]WAL65830.1 acetyltransferase [Amycolatopsis sp. HUAS 11-8]
MRIGRVLLSATSLTTMFGAFLADWNETHVHNPNWPPHAKFHNGQTMSMGLALGACALGSLWGGRPSRGRLDAATAFASLYWITQLSAALYPGTALVDPPSTRKGRQPVIAGATLALNALGYALERRRIR